MDEMLNPDQLCMGCMREKEQAGPCPYCGFDEETAPRAPHFLPYRTILNGKYLVGRVLGEGGFGITYLGWDLNLDLKVAIKEYFPSGLVERGHTQVNVPSQSDAEYYEDGRNKFAQEARSLARFYTLPGIVSVKDFFLENNTAYIAMEYLEGETLKVYLKRQGGKLPPEQVLTWMRPVIRSLAQIHKTGLIHRDISPENIMVTRDGQVKLLDFGAARSVSPRGEKSLSILLKPGYAPEEQYRTHGEQGPWTDVYALCATIYRCLTGEVPEEPLERQRKESLKPLAEFGVALPAWQEAALLKGLAVNRQMRIQDMEELERRLYAPSDLFEAEDRSTDGRRTENREEDARGTESREEDARGTETRETETQGTGTQGTEARRTDSQNGSSEEHGSSGDSGRRDKPFGKGGKRWVILGVLLVAAVAVLGLFRLLGSGGDGLTENANGNLRLRGMRTFDREAVYFYTGSGIYRAETGEEAGEPKLLTEETGSNLIRNGEYLYFLNEYIRPSRGAEIRRIRASDGRQSRTMVAEETYGFWIEEENLYYLNSDCELRCATLEGEEAETVAELPELEQIGIMGTVYADCLAEDGWFYYRNPEEKNTLWRISLEGGEPEQLTEETVGGYALDGGWIYFTDLENHAVSRMRTDGSGTEDLGIEDASIINVFDGWIYFMQFDEGGTYRVRASGEEPELLWEDTREVSLGGSWMFCDDPQGRLYLIDSESLEEQLLWGSESVWPEETEPEEAETEESAEASTEAPTEAITEASTENPAEEETPYNDTYDPELWVYGGQEMAPLDSILNRIMNDEAVVIEMGETVEAENQVRFTISRAEISQSADWMDGEAGMLVEVTAERLPDCSFAALSLNSFSIMATNESTGDVLICPRDAYCEGGIDEAISSGGWEVNTGWTLSGNTATLRFPLPAGYEDWIIVYSNVSEGEPAGPVYLLFQ